MNANQNLESKRRSWYAMHFGPATFRFITQEIRRMTSIARLNTVKFSLGFGLSLILLMGGCPTPTGTNNDDLTDPNTNTTTDPNETDPNINKYVDPNCACETETTARVYGDGSAGARTISSDLRLGDQGDTNLQYTDFTIDPNVTLTVQSGTVIRCTGTFTNNGRIVVQSGAEGGTRRSTGSSQIATTATVPVVGISTLTASIGEVTFVQIAAFGGDGGVGLSEFETATTNFSGSVAVGSGGAAAASAGGDGGGGFSVLAAQPITNNGEINADGEDAPDGGGGGGGGGGVVLASAIQVINTSIAQISANGGSGGGATDEAAPGGGGGGGIVKLLAPAITNDGATSVSSGSAGADGAANSINDAVRVAGGGGGASAGNGGRGGDIPEGSNPTPGSGVGGTSGFVIEELVDPTALF